MRSIQRARALCIQTDAHSALCARLVEHAKMRRASDRLRAVPRAELAGCGVEMHDHGAHGPVDQAGISPWPNTLPPNSAGIHARARSGAAGWTTPVPCRCVAPRCAEIDVPPIEIAHTKLYVALQPHRVACTNAGYGGVIAARQMDRHSHSPPSVLVPREIQRRARFLFLRFMKA